MNIPDQLVNEIKDGNVVVILGAGASVSATDSHGNHPPSGSGLRDLLSDRFLGGKHKDKQLNEVADYAINEGGLVKVQECIREVFEVFEPSNAQRMMTKAVWRGMATTNYDRLIERAYELESAALQKPQPFVQDTEMVDRAMRDAKSVILLKLHGCITLTADPSHPLILTPEQYLEHEKGRKRLFRTLMEWAYEHPLLFVGHGLQDPDLRNILLQLRNEMSNYQPRCYALSPDCDDIQISTWGKKGVSLLKCTFEDFMESLDKQLPQAFRQLASVRQHLTSSIVSRFTDSSLTMSPSCEQFLENDVDYVNDLKPSETVNPLDFYRGYNPGWPAIAQDLDVRRRVLDTIISDHFLVEESGHLQRMEMLLIKAHAGAGKTVSLRRLAWEVAHDYDCLCLYLRESGVIDVAALRELIALCQQRIYLFVDDAADRLRELQNLSIKIGPDGRFLTVVAAERINEWNAATPQASSLVDWDYELEYLTAKEIPVLLRLLEKHHALGTLEKLTEEQRIEALSKRAGRQLLVALHEATLGRPFVDIIEDEYRNITPIEAQHIYLTICVLNRLKVRVRAGIVSRLYGVPFEQFKERFFKPLEHVVYAKFDPLLRDYNYQARHPHIAEMVFDRILSSPELRYDAYAKCLDALNVSYADDRRAYRMMMRGKNLLELFPSHEMVSQIFELAGTRIGTDAYLLHQMAIYEMSRPSGNLRDAGDLLVESSKLATPDHRTAIKHSMAERYLRMADESRTALERQSNLNSASRIASELKSENKDSEYGYHTLIKVELARLTDLLESPSEEIPAADLIELIKNVESSVSDALQRFPGSSYILDSQAQFAEMLSDVELVEGAMEKAFSANPRSTYLASRLADVHLAKNDMKKAMETLETALSANSSDRNLHYRYAKLLIQAEPNNGELIAYHLQRAYTHGDQHYDAQILYGRQLFLNDEIARSKDVFRELEKARVGPELRHMIQHPIDAVFFGQVVKVEAFYCFIKRDGLSDWIYAPKAEMPEETWNALSFGSRTRFRVGFSFRGAVAFQVELE